MKSAFFLLSAALLGCALLSAPSAAFPANPALPEVSGVVVVPAAAAAVEYEIDGLSFGDWIISIEDKIHDVISVIKAAKEIGAIVVDKLEKIGQEALEKLITSTGNLEEALDRFVLEILPKLIAAAKSGVASLEAVADTIVAFLKQLGAKGLEVAAKWIEDHQDEVGKTLADLILSKIGEILTGGFDVAEYGLTSRGVEYLKEKIKELMKLAYDEAVVMVVNIVYYLKTYGVPALKAALDYIKEIHCELGEMVYKILHNKINDALGITDEAFVVIQPLGFKDWLESAGDKLVEIIQAGKEMGGEIGDLFKDMGDRIADLIKESSQHVKEAANNFVNTIMPKILKAIRKGGAGVNKVIAGIVSTLKKMGADAVQFAIEWLEPRIGEVDDVIGGKLLSELKKALKEMGMESGYAIGSCDVAETLAFKDWLESVGDKIAEIIESGKEIGKDAADAIKDLGDKAIAKIVAASASVKEATIAFLNTVLPKILDSAKSAIQKGGESAERVISSVVHTIKNLGSSAVETAIDWLESGKGKFNDVITGKLLSELKKALKDLAKESALDINALTAMEVLAFNDWLETIGDKIKEIIESGKGIGKDAAAAIKDLGNEAIAKIIEASASVKAAADKFLNEVLPKILEITKHISAQGREVVEKIADSVVGMLKKLGAKGLRMAIVWLEKNKDLIGPDAYYIIMNKVKQALAEIGYDSFHSFDAIDTLSFKDWLESVGDKIVGIIEAGKQLGKDAGEAIKNLGQEALDKLIAASANIQAAKQKFVEQVLPKILEKTKEIAAKGEEGAAKVIDAIVGILKKLGASGLRFAIDWMEDNKDQIGKNIYDKIVAKIEEALKEIGLEGASDVTVLRINAALAFKDWLESVGDKISGAIEAAKQIGKDAGEAIKAIGRDALDKLVEISGDIRVAKRRFVEEVLPKILEKLTAAAAKGEAAAAKVADAVVSVLKKLGAQGLLMAMEWLEKNKDDIAKNVYDKIVAKIVAALEEMGLGGVASYGAIETAEEYVKDALTKASYAGYDAAVYVCDKMIAFLKVLGVGALRIAEKIVEANKCLVGAYIYGMAMGKVKTAIKAAVIGGIVG